MESVDKPIGKAASNTLTIAQIMNEKWQDLEVLGHCAEAQGDRLLLKHEFAGALEAYSAIVAPDRVQREKIAFTDWRLGVWDSWESLGEDYAETSEEGLVIQLRSLASAHRMPDFAEHVSGMIDCVLLRQEELPNAARLLFGLAYTAVANHLNRAKEAPMFPYGSERAFQALQSLQPEYAQSLQVLALNRRVDLAGVGESSLRELLAQIDLTKCPVLGFVFSAAIQVQDSQLAQDVLKVLCARFSDHPQLIATLAIAAIQASDLGLVESLPDALAQQCLEIPEIQILAAKTHGDTDAVLQAIMRLPDGYTSGLGQDMAIHERLMKVSWRRWDVGTWDINPGFLANWAADIIPLLPPGEVRDQILLDAEMYGAENLDALTPFYCDLFNRKPGPQTLYLNGDFLPLSRLDPKALVEYIFKDATADDPYSLLLDPGFEADLSSLTERGIPEMLVAKASEVHGPQRVKYLATLTEWGLIQRPESIATFEFEKRLQGDDLPAGVAQHIEAIRSAISDADGIQLVYLQAVLHSVAAEVAKETPVASAEKAVALAINEILGLRSQSLSEIGLKRVGELTKRYSAPKLLSGLRELTKVSTTSLGTDVVDALATHMVRQQGTLSTRRSYLAAILRKRLVNLKSNWLDGQVTDCLNRGVDIEQMIELAKTVANWDDWSRGLEELRPY